MRRALLVLALGLCAALLTFPAAAQAPGWSGRIHLTETAFIGPGETLHLAPGTTVTGVAAIEVRGSLTVEGTPDAPVSISVPVRLLGEGTSTFRHARLWGVNSTALEVEAGSATLENVTFEGSSRALRALGDARVTLRDAALRDHLGEALYVDEQAQVELARVAVSGNGRGAAVYSAARLEILDSNFSANGQHVVVDLGPWSSPGTVTLRGNAFHATAPGPTPLPGIHLRHDGPLASSDDELRYVNLSGNRIEGSAIGLRAEGRGLVVESTNDTLVDNRLGLSVQLARVTLRGATLGNDRDVEGTGVTLVDAVYRDGASHAVTLSEPGEAGWGPWAIAAGVAALVALAAFVARRLRTRERPAAPPPPPVPVEVAAPVAPAPPPVRAPDLATPITSLERRILEDILAHPGTSQRAVADRLGYTRQALHYHVKRLEARGLVEKTLEGRETRCAVPAAVAGLLSTPAVTHTGSQEKA